MSYILDAIKKSEAERGNGSIPSLQTVHSSSLNYKSDNKQVWPYILIALLFLNFAGIIFYFTTNNTNSPNETISGLNNISQNHQPQAQPNVAIATTPPKAQNNSNLNSTQASDSLKRIPDQLTPPVINNAEIAPKSITPPAKSILENTDVGVIDVEDLPDYIKQRIPTMDVTGHVYSSAAIQRSIIINGNFMEEGDPLNYEFTLTEITPTGAIFDYQGTRFEVSVVTGWN